MYQKYQQIWINTVFLDFVRISVESFPLCLRLFSLITRVRNQARRCVLRRASS